MNKSERQNNKLLKLFVICYLFVNCSLLYALDSFFAGIGNELNGNSYIGMVTSIDLTLGLDINRTFCIAVKTAYHHDMNYVSTIEPRLLLRLYLTPANIRPFIQTEIGAVAITAADSNYYNFSAGITAGCRFTMTRLLYIEPALRLGYPYLWGAGITAGFILANEKIKEKSNLRFGEKREGGL